MPGMKVLFVDDGCVRCGGEGRSRTEIPLGPLENPTDSIVVFEQCPCVKAREARVVEFQRPIRVRGKLTGTRTTYEIIPKEE
jgi:hypothetical protein